QYVATIFDKGSDVRIRQGLANRQYIDGLLKRVIEPMRARSGKLALKVRATYEVWVDATPTKISNLEMKNLTSTSVTISWETNHLTHSGKVNYGTTTSYTEEVFEGDGLRDYHEVVLTDLRPATTYYFEVMNQNGGYVYDAYYALTTPAGDEESSEATEVFIPQDAVIVGDSSVAVYEEPVPTSKVVKTLLPGAQLRALVRKDGWISLLLTSGQEVWVQEEYVELVNHEGVSASSQQE
ncbi:MAG: fibronectin type III domain-containing protein, partial [bacterium]|nr:fibronectin type III domain-containing protein [bacterium]